MGATIVGAGMHHVASGLFDKVLCIGFEKQEEGDTGAILSGVAHPLYGRSMAGAAVGYFAMMGTSYMATWGAKEEHAAMVAVKARQNARKNEYAHLKLDITIEDALNSRMLAYPVRMLDMCPASNGACAVILSDEKTAKDRCKKPVWIRAMDTAHNEQFEIDWRDVTLTKPIFSTVCAAKLYKKLGVANPAEYFDVFEIYEPATWAEMVWYEDLGLCGPGQGFRLMEEGATAIEGAYSRKSFGRGFVYQLHWRFGHAACLGSGPANTGRCRRPPGAQGCQTRPGHGLWRHQLDCHDSPVKLHRGLSKLASLHEDGPCERMMA